MNSEELTADVMDIGETLLNAIQSGSSGGGGKLKDLDAAIAPLDDAKTDLGLGDHPVVSTWIGLALLARGVVAARPADVDSAISELSRAWSAFPADAGDRATVGYYLGRAHLQRADLSGSLSDIEEAVAILWQ